MSQSTLVNIRSEPPVGPGGGETDHLNRQRGIASESVKIRTCAVDDVDASLAAAWEALERRSIEGNAFLSPNFVIPAIRRLDPGVRPLLVLAERPGPLPSRLVGLGVFERKLGSRLMPLPHLQTYHSPYTSADGLLIDATCPQAALAFFDYFAARSHKWHGVAFRKRSVASRMGNLLESAAAAIGAAWVPYWEYNRAAIRPAQVKTTYMHDHFSASRRKSLRKNQRRLERLGAIKFRMVRCGPEHQACTETFLRLEAMGWKGESRTAMASNEAHAEFLREMIAGFARSNRALFTELLVDDTIVVSTCNLISGEIGYAFKIGWHTDFADYGPGTLAELQLVTGCRRELSDLQIIDGCSSPGSYLEKLWPSRRRMASGVFATSRLGRLCTSTMIRMQKVKRGLRGRPLA